MNSEGSLTSPAAAPARLWRRIPFYYGWVNLVVASIAMTATLPGRTHGLGLIAKPLTEDPALGVNDQAFSTLNFWAVLLGSALCLPAGRAIDRWGVRGVLTAVAGALGLAVVAMSRSSSWLALFFALVMIRGLGQGALSVASMAVVGKWFARRIGPAMGVYSVLLAIGFMVSTVALGQAVGDQGWRSAWAGLGYTLLAFAPCCWLFVRSTPESIGLRLEGGPVENGPAPLDLPVSQVLRMPAFWAVTLATSLFNLVWSAITLFSESILLEHGLDRDTFMLVMVVLAVSGLPANLVAGWLATRWRMERILAVGMAVLAASLAAFPAVQSTGTAIAYALGLGIAGGIVTVIFFAAYGHAFGRRHLGAIQGTVQVVTVFASAIGPVLLTETRVWTGSYDRLFIAAAGAALFLGGLCWIVRLPSVSSTVECTENLNR